MPRNPAIRRAWPTGETVWAVTTPKTIYKERAATAECANAQVRNRGLAYRDFCSGLRFNAEWDRMACQVSGERCRVLYIDACSRVLMPLSVSRGSSASSRIVATKRASSQLSMARNGQWSQRRPVYD
jgi:hypothetical protein